MNDAANYAVGSAKIIRLPGDTYTNDSCDISVHHRYQNRTAGILTVGRRDGVRLRVKPSARYNTVDEFRIYVNYTAEREVIKNSSELLNESPNSSTEHGKILRALRKAYHSGNGREVTATVEYVVSEQQLRDSGGRLYLADLDLLLETEGVAPMSHPFSHNGIDRQKIDSLMPDCGNETFVFMFKAVDNSDYSLYGDRFINIGGMVFKVPVERDDAYATGFHVVCRKPVEVVGEGKKGSSDLDSTFYTFDQADVKFGLYLTAEEAKVAGPIADAMKEQANLQAARDKLEAMRDERELQKMKSLQLQQKLELDMLVSEERSFLEYAKVGTGILTAVITVLTVWQKLANK